MYEGLAFAKFFIHYKDASNGDGNLYIVIIKAHYLKCN